MTSNVIDQPLPQSQMTINGIVARNVERYRLKRHMSASHVARAAGVSKGTLLSIELGRANPTLETLQSIAGALGVELSALIAEGPVETEIDVRRVSEVTWRTLDGMRMRPLTTFYGPEMVYLFTAEVNADGVVSAAHEIGSAEGILVLSGTVLAGPIDSPVELNEGDWARFSTERPHCCRSKSGTAKVVYIAVRQIIPGTDSISSNQAGQIANSLCGC